MTSRLRQLQGGSAGASSTEPITRAAVLRTLVVAAGVGGFLSFVGAFGTDGAPLIPRTILMVTLALAGSTMGLVTFRFVAARGWGAPHRWVQGIICGGLMTIPMGLVVWGMIHLFTPNPPGLSALPGYIGTSLVMCLVLTTFFVTFNRRAHLADLQLAAVVPAPPKFLERLPLKLRGAEVWAVEAEDHYLRLHTSKGQDLILLRLADAIDELAGIEGVQVHRSWWVARNAITDAQRADGRATLTLKDGVQVPVSRTYAKIIRDLGWI